VRTPQGTPNRRGRDPAGDPHRGEGPEGDPPPAGRAPQGPQKNTHTEKSSSQRDGHVKDEAIGEKEMYRYIYLNLSLELEYYNSRHYGWTHGIKTGLPHLCSSLKTPVPRGIEIPRMIR